MTFSRHVIQAHTNYRASSIAGDTQHQEHPWLHHAPPTEDSRDKFGYAIGDFAEARTGRATKQ